MDELINYNESILPNGNILICRATLTGRSCATPIFFGIYHIEWEGVCDPLLDGYRKLAGNFYCLAGRIQGSIPNVSKFPPNVDTFSGRFDDISEREEGYEQER